MSSATVAVNRVPEAREAVEARLDALESKVALDQELAAEAVAVIRRPDEVRERLGAALRYSQRVEADVAGVAIDILLPHDADDHLGRFLAAWVPDELGHAAAQEALLRALDLPIYEARNADYVPIHNRVAGTLARLSDRAYDIVSMMYHTIGSLNERLAMGAYRRMAEIAAELDEPELVDHLFKPTARDEAFHLALENDPDNPSIADTVHDIAQDLLARDRDDLPRFTHRALASCVAQARRARIAATT